MMYHLLMSPLLLFLFIVAHLCWCLRLLYSNLKVEKRFVFWAVDQRRTQLGSLSSNVFERRTSTGSGLFSNFDGGFAQIFSQIASITVKKLRNTNFISSRHVKRENTSLPVDVRPSKTSLLKLPIRTPDPHAFLEWDSECWARMWFVKRTVLE